MTKPSSPECLVGYAMKYVTNLRNFVLLNTPEINNRISYETSKSNVPDAFDFITFYRFLFGTRILHILRNKEYVNG